MAKPLKGWRSVGGSSRHYLTPSGREVSRYQYEKAVARKQGFKSVREKQRFRQSDSAWGHWQFKARATGNVPASDLAASGDLFAAARALERQRLEIRERAAAGRGIKRLEAEMNAKGGPLEQLLISIGAREPDWDFAVGETPTGYSGK